MLCKRPPVEDDGRGRGGPVQQHALQLVQIVHDGFEYAGIPPAGPLLVDRRPGRQVVGQVAPLAAGVAQVAQGVEQGPQRVLPLGRVFAHQGQIRGHKGPFIVLHIAGVTARRVPYPKFTPQVHNRL